MTMIKNVRYLFMLLYNRTKGDVSRETDSKRKLGLVNLLPGKENLLTKKNLFNLISSESTATLSRIK